MIEPKKNFAHSGTNNTGIKRHRMKNKKKHTMNLLTSLSPMSRIMDGNLIKLQLRTAIFSHCSKFLKEIFRLQIVKVSSYSSELDLMRYNY